MTSQHKSSTVCLGYIVYSVLSVKIQNRQGWNEHFNNTKHEYIRLKHYTCIKNKVAFRSQITHLLKRMFKEIIIHSL